MDRLTAGATLYRDIARRTICAVAHIKKTAATVASNIQWLKEASGDTYRDIEKRCGVGHSIIQRIVTGERSPTIDQAEAIASAYGLEGWHLLLPNLPHDVAQTKTLSSLVESYIKSSQAGRDNISRVAEFEARYASSKPV